MNRDSIKGAIITAIDGIKTIRLDLIKYDENRDRWIIRIINNYPNHESVPPSQDHSESTVFDYIKGLKDIKAANETGKNLMVQLGLSGSTGIEVKSNVLKEIPILKKIMSKKDLEYSYLAMEPIVRDMIPMETIIADTIKAAIIAKHINSVITAAKEKKITVAKLLTKNKDKEVTNKYFLPKSVPGFGGYDFVSEPKKMYKVSPSLQKAKEMLKEHEQSKDVVDKTTGNNNWNYGESTKAGYIIVDPPSTTLQEDDLVEAMVSTTQF